MPSKATEARTPIAIAASRLRTALPTAEKLCLNLGVGTLFQLREDDGLILRQWGEEIDIEEAQDGGGSQGLNSRALDAVLRSAGTLKGERRPL